MHLERVETNSKGAFKFFPFVVEPRHSDPKIIEIDPMVGFGKPVIGGTAISTAIIASRFNAQESITSLAEEYGGWPIRSFFRNAGVILSRQFRCLRVSIFLQTGPPERSAKKWPHFP